jgi:hypothetical protein
MIMEEKKHEMSKVPAGAVEDFDTGNVWNAQDGIMSMRWENKELIAQLWKNLAYMNPTLINGKPYLVPSKMGRPPINYEGAKAIINIIQSVVNTVGSLSKIHNDQALILMKHIKQATRRLVVVKGEEYECTQRVDKQIVLQIVENICLLQLMRAVNGHESQHSRSNLIEKDERGTYTTSEGKKGFNMFPGAS